MSSENSGNDESMLSAPMRRAVVLDDQRNDGKGLREPAADGRDRAAPPHRHRAHGLDAPQGAAVAVVDVDREGPVRRAVVRTPDERPAAHAPLALAAMVHPAGIGPPSSAAA